MLLLVLLLVLLSSIFCCGYYCCFIVIVSCRCGGGSHGNVIIGVDSFLTYIIVFIIISTCLAIASMSNVVSLPQEERDAPGPPEHGTGIVVAPPVRG